MLSLKKLCLLRVSSLKLAYEEDDVPKPLGEELEKMYIFNGSFFGQVYFYNLVARQGEIEQMLTIQYQGDGVWAFSFCQKCDTCGGPTCDGTGHMDWEKPEKVQFVLKENETSDSEAAFSTVMGLSDRATRMMDLVIWKKWDKQQQVSTVLSVQDGNVPGSSQLVLSSSVAFESGLVNSAKLWVDSTLEGSPVFKRSFGEKWSDGDLMLAREIPLLLTECPVLAVEAFRDSITECGYFGGHGDLNEGEDEESD
eukprot:GFUD01032481.1.p1 GENE.GFUD01032481.1~~GFUD01032481.1.p1  ORF type:complete len:253 (-),score=77.15 GFUD01032481.1:86-844(-)